MSNSGFTVRLATRQDLPGIVDIYNSTVPSRMVTADTAPVTVQSREAWFDAHQPERRPLWVCTAADSRMAGWVSFSDFYGRPAYGATAEVSIYLHEAFRGQGLGRYLLEQAIAHAPKVGVNTLLGFIFGHNAPSLALFERHGFVRWGDLPRVAVLDGIERDLVIVGRRLD
ncbi:GNAT family N-acetyltransferase [Cupriavidus pauculus]|uniref:GNAT family N-acetyltransferase n=1 Tax=Cupriavidus pauculus TaxID=82633 RepID=UPI001246B5A5|nr:GNAT family N-acetyltransferase [Cupriavidus pauculus]KAB0605098.1 N-acetyltransferase family protein [Cupriavidus pauculus]MCM3604991.1 N-acetyltransferase family protein [Cupriavidus pauculus]UAK99454.1 GNAT family N-acetyltransferase [Cupriavidus pauculus]